MDLHPFLCLGCQTAEGAEGKLGDRCSSGFKTCIRPDLNTVAIEHGAVCTVVDHGEKETAAVIRYFDGRVGGIVPCEPYSPECAISHIEAHADIVIIVDDNQVSVLVGVDTGNPHINCCAVVRIGDQISDACNFQTIGRADRDSAVTAGVTIEVNGEALCASGLFKRASIRSGLIEEGLRGNQRGDSAHGKEGGNGFSSHGRIPFKTPSSISVLRRKYRYVPTIVKT